MGISDQHSSAEKGFTGSTTECQAKNGEYKIDVAATCNFSYHYTFLDEHDKGSVFDLANVYLADYFRKYGRCVTVIDARVYEIYGESMRAYFEHHGLKLEVLAMGIDEEQKSLKTCEDCMVFFADIGLMRRETPLVVGGGLITDIIGTACSLYRRSTSYVRLPTTLIGLIDASVAIKVGGNLAGKYKNRIGAFHPHAGVILDFHFLKSLSRQHIRNGLAELTKISTVEEPRCFELIETHCEDLLKYKFGYLEEAEDGSKCPDGLKEVAQELCRRAVLRMLQLECPNLHEHDQRRAIAYGHTWSPCYELAQSPPMHHGHAIAVDMCFSLTWAEKLGYVDSALKERVFNVFRRIGLSLMHPWFDEASLKKGTDTIMARRDGDLFAAIPDGQVGVCRYVMIGDFQDGPQNKSGGEVSREEARAAMDASLEEALIAHRDYMQATEGDKYSNGVGVGNTPYITLGHARKSDCGDFCACSKLELGTWAERLCEMCEEVESSQTFENVREKVQGIARWWDMCGEYMKNHSSPLGETALKILAEQQKDGVFPEGMTVDWALDMQSAQTLDFLAALKANSSKAEGQNVVAWDLGTLTGVSAAVLAAHFDKVESVERNEHLAKFATNQLQGNVSVHLSEIDAWLETQAQAGNQADMIFMDLDKTAYEPLYRMIMERNLLKGGGLLVADNVLYRGLPAEIAEGEVDLRQKYRAKEGSEMISEKTVLNAEALVKFNALVKSEVDGGAVRSLMLPVRDGMMAVVKLTQASPPPVS